MRLPVLALALFAAGCADGSLDSPTADVTSAESAADAPADAPLAAFAEDAPELLAALRSRFDATSPAEYRAAGVDLDGDGTDEVVAHVIGPDVCGTGGCQTYVFQADGDSLRQVTSMSVSRTPVAVSVERSNGWLDLLVQVSGGGAEAGTARMKHTGRGYPTNPTRQSLTDEEGAVLISGDMTDRALPIH